MKTTTCKYTFMLLLYALMIGQSRAQVVEIILDPPSPQNWHVEEAWNFMLINTTSSFFKVRAHAEVFSDIDGKIFQGTSAVFGLEPNFKGRPELSDLEPVQDGYANAKYEDFVRETGRMMDGNYKICITINDDAGNELGHNCTEIIISNYSSPELVFPKNESKVEELFPVFTWFQPAPVSPGDEISYTIRIVNVLDGQGAIEAMESNPAWFEEPEINTTTLQYPEDSKAFVTKNEYAWKITAKTKDGSSLESPVWSFSYIFKDDIYPADQCKICKDSDWVFGPSTITTRKGNPFSPSYNNAIYLTQPLQILSDKTVLLKAEVIYFRWFNEKADCIKCSNNDATWANLIGGTVNDQDFMSDGFSPKDESGAVYSNSHELYWLPVNGPAAFNGNINLTISLPLQTTITCCKDCFRFCIRYTYAIKDLTLSSNCIFCSYIKCYQIERQHVNNFPSLYSVCGDPYVIEPPDSLGVEPLIIPDPIGPVNDKSNQKNKNQPGSKKQRKWGDPDSL